MPIPLYITARADQVSSDVKLAIRHVLPLSTLSDLLQIDHSPKQSEGPELTQEIVWGGTEQFRLKLKP